MSLVPGVWGAVDVDLRVVENRLETIRSFAALKISKISVYFPQWAIGLSSMIIFVRLQSKFPTKIYHVV